MSTEKSNAAPDEGDNSSFVVQLSKPIMAYTEELKELKFRAPTGMDMLQVGNPVEIDMTVEPPKLTHDWSKMGQMISRLAQIPMSSVGKMDTRDQVACAWMITPFFVPTL